MFSISPLDSWTVHPAQDGLFVSSTPQNIRLDIPCSIFHTVGNAAQ